MIEKKAYCDLCGNEMPVKFLQGVTMSTGVIDKEKGPVKFKIDFSLDTEEYILAGHFCIDCVKKYTTRFVHEQHETEILNNDVVELEGVEFVYGGKVIECCDIQIVPTKGEYIILNHDGESQEFIVTKVVNDIQLEKQKLKIYMKKENRSG
jgi:hypothetical protein